MSPFLILVVLLYLSLNLRCFLSLGRHGLIFIGKLLRLLCDGFLLCNVCVFHNFYLQFVEFDGVIKPLIIYVFGASIQLGWRLGIVVS